MKGHEHGVLADGGCEVQLEVAGSSPGTQADQLAVAHPQASGRARMSLGEGLGGEILQLRDTVRLLARLVVGQQSAGGQVQRVFVVELFGRRHMHDSMEPGSPSRSWKSVKEETRRPGMIEVR